MFLEGRFVWDTHRSRITGRIFQTCRLFLDVGYGHHAYSHEESVKEDAGNCDCELRELEQDSSLCDEVDALRSAGSFFRKGKAVDNRGCAGNLFLSEQPLIRLFDSHFECRGGV